MKTSRPADASTAPSPYARELIEKEIAHLKKGRSSRQAKEASRSRAGTLLCGLVLILFGLYALDPIIFSYNRNDAIRVYLYLHNYGNDRQADAVATCGLLNLDEVHVLNLRRGAFQDYFDGTGAAEQKALELIGYMNGVHALHQHQYSSLSALNKLRYILFVKTGLTPPIRWNFLTSAIDK